MNAQETLEIIKALHAVGATHFKSSDFEVSLTGVGSSGGKSDLPAPSAQAAVPAVENEVATAKLKDLISTLKMNDTDLMDRIFPAGAGG